VHRILKYIAYIALFVGCFIIFLYWMFPYESLKERLVSGIERQLGGQIEVSAGEFEPYWITGFEIKKLAFNTRDDNGKAMNAITLDKLRVRVALLSLIIGSPRVSYYMRAGKGEIEGAARQTAEGIEFDADFDDFDISAIGILSSRYGLKLSGILDGYVEMKIDRRRVARSSGTVELDLKNLKLGESNAQLGPMEMPVPPLIITKAKGSSIKMTVYKGAVLVDKLVFAGGDLGLDVNGKIFLSNTFPNSRFNLKGSFTASPALDKALPFLFIVEKEKKADGSYPFSVTGRISSPVIKVGNFTLPL